MSKNKHPVRDSSVWIRLVFVLLFVIIYGLVQNIVFLIALVQAIISLCSRNRNEALQKFGSSLAEYSKLLGRYCTFNTDVRPFPFADWKAGDPPDSGLAVKKRSAAKSKSAATSTSRRKKPAVSAANSTANTSAATTNKTGSAADSKN